MYYVIEEGGKLIGPYPTRVQAEEVVSRNGSGQVRVVEPLTTDAPELVVGSLFEIAGWCDHHDHHFIYPVCQGEVVGVNTEAVLVRASGLEYEPEDELPLYGEYVDAENGEFEVRISLEHVRYDEYEELWHVSGRQIQADIVLALSKT